MDERLFHLIEHARTNVAFYRRWLEGLPHVQTVDELSKLPLLHRRDVQAAGTDLVVDGVNPSKLRKVHTGGTTGVALELYRDPDDAMHEQARIRAARMRFGVPDEAKIVAVVGRPVGEDGRALFVPRSRTLWLGSGTASLSHDLFVEHYSSLCEFRPHLVRGYPTMLAMLSQSMLDEGLPPPASIIAVESSSEVLHRWQADLIHDAFGVPHHNLYGQVEHVAMASSCPHSPELHVDQTYGVVELTDDDGQVIRHPNVVGEVVATGLGNWTTPLIRYRTGDRASWADDECPCANQGPRLAGIEGRIREVLIDRHGQRHVFGNRFYGRLWVDGSPLRQAQFRHPGAGQLRLEAVLRDDVDRAAAARWLCEALSHLDEFDVTVTLVGEVQRTAVGKQPLLLME